MRLLSIVKFAAAGVLAVALVAPALKAQATDTVLKREDVQKLLADKVFYKGQSATTQLRNSGGVKFADGYYVLTTLVDTSGYSSDVATKYQAYFIVETPLKIAGQPLPAGIYGIGFIDGNKFVVTDVGAHDVLTVTYTADEALKRPLPLQVVADPAGGFRLYINRHYVLFSRQ